MERTFFDTDEELIEAEKRLRALGVRAIKALGEIVEETEITRSKLSATMRSLESEGLIMIREVPDFMDVEYKISATLHGWELMSHVLDQEDAKAASKASKP